MNICRHLAHELAVDPEPKDRTAHDDRETEQGHCQVRHCQVHQEQVLGPAHMLVSDNHENHQGVASEGQQEKWHVEADDGYGGGLSQSVHHVPELAEEIEGSGVTKIEVRAVEKSEQVAKLHQMPDLVSVYEDAPLCIELQWQRSRVVVVMVVVV